MKEKDTHGGARKGAGRPSKAEEQGLSGALQSSFKKVLRSLPKEDKKRLEDLQGHEAVISTMWEIALGMHSAQNPTGEMGIQDLKKRFEATKEISKLYYGPSPEGVVGHSQNKLEIKDIADLVGFIQPNNDKEDESTEDNAATTVSTTDNSE